jgi:ubiquinone biosynthesis protein
VLQSQTVFGRALHDLNRLRQIAAAMARHGFGAYLERMRLRDVLGREAPPSGEPLPSADRATAARFRQMLAELGPTFIKLGQILSSRPDLLPAVWVEELSVLQDDCPPLAVTEVRQEIERGLGRPVEELFASLDDRPLASASIAQVHRAVTHAGEQVAVKVLRPNARARIEADVSLLYEVARLLEAVVEETGVTTPTGVVEEFDRSVHEELDFSHEARNVQLMADAAARRGTVIIPKVHAALSCGTVLTLDFIEGVKISDITAATGHDLEQVARNIIEASFRQLFEDGLFHGDPHPGNILVQPDNRIALLDFGLVGRISRGQQDALVTLLVAVALRDAESVARVLTRIGLPDAHTSLVDLRQDVTAILDRYIGLKLNQIRTATLLRDLLDLAVRHHIRIPQQYATLAKAAMAVEGIVRRLHPTLDVMEVGLPYAKELLLARFHPGDASTLVMRSLLKLQTLAEDLPTQLAQILQDLESGKFRVHVSSESLDRLGGHVRALGVMIMLGSLAAAFTLGGLVVLGEGGSAAMGAAALVTGGVLSLSAAAYHLLTVRLRKISIRRWLRR